MTDREKMEALLDGDMLEGKRGKFQALMMSNGKELIVREIPSCVVVSTGLLWDKQIDWQIKPKEITLTREDLRAAYNQALWPYRPNLKDHESENFKEVCQNLGL